MNADPILAFGSESPVDLLNNAASVTRFLVDVSPAFAHDGAQLGLSEESAHGLGLILMVVESTISEAVARI
ncbi:MAG: hypothetical protein ACYC9M_02900 [Desulfobulbaceae bacterium]